MEEFGSVIAVIIGILWYALPLILRAMKAKGGGQQPAAIRQPVPNVDFGRLSLAIQHGNSQLDWLDSEGKRLSKSIGASLGPARVLGEVLEQFALVHRELRAALRSCADEIDRRSIPFALPDLLRRLEWQRMRMAAVGVMFDVRADRVTGEMMADADAIAAAHLQPIVDFTQSRGIAFPHRRPVCIPAVPGQEAVFFGLLPDGYPTVFVPPDFRDELLRWPAVSHEIGHVVWRELPGFAEDMRQAMRLRVEPLIATSPRAFDVRRCYAAWLEEIFCDFFAVLQLGPPALRGMIELFSPKNVPPQQLVWAASTLDRKDYEEHPPPHLRIKLAAHALWEMGFDAEAKQLLRQWAAKVGEPESYGFPALISAPFGIGAESVEAFGRTLVERMYETQLDSLAGFSLSSISGLEMTPGLWGHVLKEKAALLAGDAHHDDPRVVICAAIEARAGASSSSRALARTVTRAIVGINEPRHRADERAPVEVPSGAANELLEAMVLYQVLRRRPRAGGRRAREGRL